MKRFNLYTSFTFAAVSFGLAGCASETVPVKPPPVQPARTTASAGASSSSSSSDAVSAAAKPAEPRPAGIETFRGQLVASQEQIDKTLASLAELTDPNQVDIPGAYERYSTNIALMNDHAASMRREADAMRASRDEYFAKWEEKVAEIDNPTIRQSAEARRKRLRAAHEQIIMTSSDARDAYDPFMKDLQDIKKFVGSDLTKSGVGDIAGAAKKVQGDGVVVKEKIGNVVRTLDSVQAQAEATPPTPAPALTPQ